MATLPLADQLFTEDGAGDSLFAGYIGEIRLWPFRAEKLPPGWFIPDGSSFLLTSYKGQRLNNLDSDYKQDLGIVISGNYISMPDLFDENGNGYFIRPVNGTNRGVGSIQIDSIRNIKGTVGDFQVHSVVNPSINGPWDIHNVTYNLAFANSGNSSYRLISINFNAENAGVEVDYENRPINIGFIPGMYLGIG
jgi:hypothetical protein